MFSAEDVRGAAEGTTMTEMQGFAVAAMLNSWLDRGKRSDPLPTRRQYVLARVLVAALKRHHLPRGENLTKSFDGFVRFLFRRMAALKQTEFEGVTAMEARQLAEEAGFSRQWARANGVAIQLWDYQPLAQPVADELVLALCGPYADTSEEAKKDEDDKVLAKTG